MSVAAVHHTEPHAGQVWRAPVHGSHRYRYVRLEQVRSPHQCPYALAHEVTRTGNPARGEDASGIARNQQITIALRFVGGRLAMPPWYELCDAID